MIRPVLLLLAALLASLPLAARADDGQINDGSYGPEPIGATISGPADAPIRLVSQHVVVNLNHEYARLSTRYVFRNDSPAGSVTVKLGFPRLGPAWVEADRRKTPGPGLQVTGPVQLERVIVDGEDRTLEMVYDNVANGTSEGDAAPRWHATKAGDKDALLMAWGVLTLVLPAQKDVVIERRCVSHVGVTPAADNGVHFTFTYRPTVPAGWLAKTDECTVEFNFNTPVTASDILWAKTDPTSRPPSKDWEIVSPQKARVSWKLADAPKVPRPPDVSLVLRSIGGRP